MTAAWAWLTSWSSCSLDPTLSDRKRSKNSFRFVTAESRNTFGLLRILDQDLVAGGIDKIDENEGRGHLHSTGTHLRAAVLPLHESNPANHSKYANLCGLLDARHGDEPAAEFGPRKLESLRDVLVTKGVGKNPKPNSRSYANDQVRKVIKIIEHWVSRELVAPDRIVALRSLPPLRRGQARDNAKRTGVSLDVVRATLPHLTSTAAAMIRLQLATAMRPSEMFRMTPAMIDRGGPVWFYRPTSHKTEHHGKAKSVPILGEALEALTPYLFGDEHEHCFLTSKVSIAV